MESETCFITTKSRLVNPPSSLHFEQKIVLNGHCGDSLPPRSSSRISSSTKYSNGLIEQKRWAASDSKETGISDIARQFNQNDANSSRRDLKLPSYVGISCAISGYSSYSRYCSSARGSVSRGSSPVMRNYEVIDGTNCVYSHHHSSHHNHHEFNHTNHYENYHNNNHNNDLSSQHQQPFVTTTTITTSRTCNNGDGVSDHAHENNDLITVESKFGDDINGGSSEKSLVQRRIESLYGPNAAEIWRDSRSKVKKINKKNSEIIAHRSPSCPPHALRSRECKKSPAVFNNLNEKFLNQIDGEPKELAKVLSNKFDKVLKINGETNGSLDNNKENGHHSSKEYGESEKENRHVTDNLEPVFDQVDRTVDRPSKLSSKKENSQKEVKNGEMYIKKLEETIKDIQIQVTMTEKFLEEESHLMSEEVKGNLRSSIGKGNLLIAQKLNQFRELCYKNINGNSEEQFATKNEDLDGFWEMVYLQVLDVHKTFEELVKLRQNNWIIDETDKVTQPKNRSPRKFSTPKASPSKPSKNTARDEMRRQRLREAKLKNQARLQEMKDEEIVIFVPPNNDTILNNNGSQTDM